MPRVVHFEISADDTDRAAKFYQTVFGWTSNKLGGPRDYHLVNTGPETEPGINGGIFRRDGPVNFVNTIEVDSVDEFSRRIVEAGGEEVVPKMHIPGAGYLIYCKDTEGNVFGIIEDDDGLSQT